MRVIQQLLNFPTFKARAMNEYLANIETEHANGDIVRDFVEYNALSSSEAQAYAFDELAENQRVISVWQRVL